MDATLGKHGIRIIEYTGRAGTVNRGGRNNQFHQGLAVVDPELGQISNIDRPVVS